LQAIKHYEPGLASVTYIPKLVKILQALKHVDRRADYGRWQGAKPGAFAPSILKKKCKLKKNEIFQILIPEFNII
jgi:hypothetical protein